MSAKHGIIGTYQFEDENESDSNGEYGTFCGSSEEVLRKTKTKVTQMMNTERFVAVLRKFWKDENESGSNGEYVTFCGSSEEVLRKTKMKVAQTVNTERFVAVLRKFWTSLG